MRIVEEKISDDLVEELQLFLEYYLNIYIQRQRYFDIFRIQKHARDMINYRMTKCIQFWRSTSMI